MADISEIRMVKRLNTTLPDPLALYVGEITGKGSLYETPGEFIRDLVRRHMEAALDNERGEIRALLRQSLREDQYEVWSDDDLADARSSAGA